MTTSQIKYRGGYKYQLAEDLEVEVSIKPTERVEEPDFIVLGVDGRLRISRTYAWDGPSGPAIDSPNFMRGALVHDALYQLMRHDHLSSAEWKDAADLELKRICRDDGMSRVRAWWVYRAVRALGDIALDPASGRQVRTAP